MNAFWHEMAAEFSRIAVTKSVGGGIIGALCYQIFYPLLGHIGLRIIAILLIPSGILMFFDVKFATLIKKFQSFSQLFINKNKAAGSKIKDKYSLLKERQEQKKEQENARNLRDPLSDNSTIFPDVEDFSVDDVPTENSTAATGVNDFDSGSAEFDDVPEHEPVEPQIQVASQNNIAKKQTHQEPVKVLLNYHALIHLLQKIKNSSRI